MLWHGNGTRNARKVMDITISEEEMDANDVTTFKKGRDVVVIRRLDT
jgi:hypothetical protein